ncbi:MAG: toll/interleukin-1 receptor domain-containing protein [Candidatus Magnetomorum sp.]|nr:toll/interleukin-1 receptor domain-containing protein [Candidatus Magnetomorum sp.]
MTNRYQPPKRFFEEQGFVSLESCYLVSLENVVNTKNQNIQKMVNLGRFFTIFAPRQSGKTTFFYDFCRSIEHDPLYIAILFSFQTCQNLTGEQFYQFIDENLKEQIHDRLTKLNCKEFNDVMTCMNEFPIKDHTSFYRLFKKFNSIIHQKKIVIFIDEFDGMPLSELENFLMVLRDLYQNYKHTQKKALYSVGLVGIRNIAKLVVGGVSPFNIADQVNLPMFSLKNVRDLYAQYTQESHQPFTEKAVCKVYKQTCGQPWMVNRLGTILTINIKPQTTDPIDETDVDAAIALLVKENNAHFDNLYEKILLYKETFVKALLQDIDNDPNDTSQNYLKQYGLLKELNDKTMIANPIYKKRFFSISKQRDEQTNPNQSDTKRTQPVIFLCHAKEDVQNVKSLYSRLKQEGMSPWLDEMDILPGQNWDLEIQRAIKATDFALICLSRTSVEKRGYLNKEIKWALDKQAEMPEGHIFLIPVKMESCELQHQLAGIHAVDLYADAGFDKLLRALKYQSGQKVVSTKTAYLPIDQLIQQLKNKVDKLSLNPQDKAEIKIQFSILESQSQSNRKNSTIIQAVLETIAQIVKDADDSELRNLLRLKLWLF